MHCKVSPDEGAPRRAKACNPAGTNPADLDIAHALALAGPAAIGPATAALSDGFAGWWVRAAAASVLGAAGAAEDDTAAAGRLGALTTAMGEVDDWVRRNAAESVGIVLQLDRDRLEQAAVLRAVDGLVSVAGWTAADLRGEDEDESWGSVAEQARLAAAVALCRCFAGLGGLPAAAAAPAVAALAGLGAMAAEEGLSPQIRKTTQYWGQVGLAAAAAAVGPGRRWLLAGEEVVLDCRGLLVERPSL